MSKTLDEAVVLRSLVKKLSLTATGIPPKGREISTVFAISSACFLFKVKKAFSFLSTDSIRAKQSATNSFGEIFLERRSESA